VTTKTRTKAKAKAKIKLDIACGQNKQEGFRGVDISPDADADDIHDLTVFPWPYEDNSVEEAFCSHYVEHTPDLIAFMNEVYRILAPEAQIRIVHPHLRSDRAFQDPTHTRFIPEATWPYFAKDWREINKLDHYPITTDFGIENMFFAGFHGDWGSRHEGARQFALAHYWNVATDLVVDLRARK
jgi:predicted SAM-dependent methyltransferase